MCLMWCIYRLKNGKQREGNVRVHELNFLFLYAFMSFASKIILALLKNDGNPFKRVTSLSILR